MRIDPNPLFRRIIMPWYDSTAVCWLLLVSMVIVMLFSIVGIFVAWRNPAYLSYRIVPWVLAALSFFVVLSVSARLIQRHYLLHKDTVEP